MSCVHHGNDFMRHGKCLACEGRRQRHAFSNGLILCLIGVLALITLTVNYWAPLLGM